VKISAREEQEEKNLPVAQKMGDERESRGRSSLGLSEGDRALLVSFLFSLLETYFFLAE